MPKLFAVMLGGRAKGCNIELHDVVFAVGESFEAICPQLINKWFGEKTRLHVDSYIELSQVDGHEIILTKTKPMQEANKLFFVNFGGYRPNYFGEIHEINFYVASEKKIVITRAKQELCLGLSEQHCDDNLAIDDVLQLDSIDNYYIELRRANKPRTLEATSRYVRLDKPAILEQAQKINA